MLTRTQRLIVNLVMALPVAVMLVWMIFYVLRQIEHVTANLAPIAVYELERATGREVAIGRITVTEPGVAVAEDVRISEGPTFSGGTLLTADRVIIRYDLRDILFGGLGAAAISAIEVHSPTLLVVRRPNGTFNISDLLRRPPGPRRPPFTGTVTISDGTIKFHDYLARATPLPARVTLHNVDGVVDASDVPRYLFRAVAAGTRDEFGRLRVVGIYNSSERTLRLDTNAVAVNARFASRFAPFLGDIEALGGTVRPNLGFTARRVGNRWVTTVNGVLGLNNVVARLPGMLEPVRGLSGNVVLARDQAAMSLNGVFADSPVRVTGTVSDLRSPHLDLVVSSRSARFARMLDAISFLRTLREILVSGVGPVSARITGPIASPTVSVTATIPRASVRGYEATNVRLSATYRRGVVDIHSLRMNVAGGMIVASGTIATTGVPKLDIRGQAIGIDASRLSLPTAQRVTGRIDAQFRISGTTGQPTVIATATVRRGTLGGIAVEGPLRITFRQGRIEAIGQLVVHIAGGVVRLDGAITPARINARYWAEGLDLALLGRYINLRGLGGVLFSTGRVTGSTTDPAVSGTVEVFNVTYQNFAADYARMAFTGSRRGVTVSEGILRVLPAEIAFTGTADGLQGPRIEFRADVRARRVRVDQLLALLGRDLDVTGTITGDFVVSGAYLTRRPAGVRPFVDTVASGTLQLEDGTAFGYPINSASAAVSYAGDVLRIQDAAITSDGAQAVVGGTVSIAGGVVELTFDLAGLDLSRLRDRLGQYVILAGVLNASGGITGPLASPVVTVGAAVNDFIVNATRFDQATFTATYSANVFDRVFARLTRGQQTYEVQASDVNVATQCLAGATIRVANGSVPDLWTIMTSSPYLAMERARELREVLRTAPRLTSGTVEMTANLSGCLANPDGSLSLVARDVGFDERRVESIVVSAASTNGVVTLNEARAVSGDMYVEATPVEPGVPVYVDGLVRAAVSAYNVDLARLRPWLGGNTPSGVLTARFDIVGPAARPSIVGSVEVENPGYGGVVFDRLRASRIEVTGNAVTFTDIILASNGHQIIGRGTLPWSWEDFTIPSDQPLSFTAELQREDLSIVSAFVQTIDPATTTGPIQAAFDISGTLADLRLNGMVQVANGTIGLRGFRNVFNDVNVDLVFDNKRVLVNEFSAQSSLGGTVEVLPGSYITMGSPETSGLSLLVAARGLTISETNALGYQEDIVTQVDAALAVSGNLASPLIAERPIDTLPGGVTIYNSTLVFAIPEQTLQPQPREFAVNPRFDVGIDIGPNVTVRPPRMTLLVSGGGRVGGTLERPDMHLEVAVDRGSLMLGTSVLRVVPGGTVEVTYTPPEAPSLFLRGFQATTSVTATSPLGRRERYVITIQVSGPVQRLNIDLTSSPPGLTREQMLAALGHVEGLFATAEGTLQQELANVLTAVGTSTLFAPVERLFIERLGFEQFTLEYSALTPLALFVSARLVDSVYISYYQRLTGELVGANAVSYQLQLSYRFKRLYHISFGVDDQQFSTIEVGYQSAF